MKNKENILVIDNNDKVSYQRSSMNTDYVYKASLKDLKEFLDESPDMIFSCDTENCIRLITDDGEEISLHQFTEDMSLSFLKLITHELEKADSNILISLTGDNYINNKHYVKYNIYWGDAYDTGTRTLPASDINGYENTMKIISGIDLTLTTINKACQAVSYCVSKRAEISGTLYQGYLPAAKQLDIFNQNLDLLVYILIHIYHGLDCPHIKVIPYDLHHVFQDNYIWSSTEESKAKVSSLYNGKIVARYKAEDGVVIPFFKEIKDL